MSLSSGRIPTQGVSLILLTCVADTYRLQASSQTVSIHPSSVLHAKKPRCIVFDELLRTTRSYARNVTVVEPSWLPEAAPMYFHGKVGGL